jgi:hypothetical protein
MTKRRSDFLPGHCPSTVEHATCQETRGNPIRIELLEQTAFLLLPSSGQAGLFNLLHLQIHT